MKKPMHRDFPLSPTPQGSEVSFSGPKPPKAKEIKNAAADATVGKEQKRKERMTKIAGMGAVAAYAIGDMINTKRRLTGKSYIPTKNNP